MWCPTHVCMYVWAKKQNCFVLATCFTKASDYSDLSLSVRCVGTALGLESPGSGSFFHLFVCMCLSPSQRRECNWGTIDTTLITKMY